MIKPGNSKVTTRDNTFKNIRVDSRRNDTTELLECWEKLSARDKDVFYERYGKIADLLQMQVQWDALKALTEYWNPSYRCFTIGEIDTTPTIEEYDELLGVNKNIRTRFYQHHHGGIADKRLGSILGATIEHIRAVKISKGQSKGWYWSSMRSYFFASLNDLDCTRRIRILALGIYGLVLLPSAMLMIDDAAVNAFNEIEVSHLNPSSVILAETFMTLDHCRIKGGTLRCCHQLLYVWMVSHIWSLKGKILPCYSSLKNTLREFQTKLKEKLSNMEWEEMISNLQETNFQWKAIWMPKCEYLLSCGSYPWVPLVGARGCIGYAPSLVLRQFGHAQYIPELHGLQEMSFNFSEIDTQEKLKIVQESWNHVCISGKEKCNTDNSLGYATWQKKRKRGYTLPRMMGPSCPPPFCTSTEDFFEEAQARQEAHHDELKRKMRIMWEEKCRIEEMNAILQQENQILHSKLKDKERELKEMHGVKEKAKLLNTQLREEKENNTSHQKKFEELAETCNEMVIENVQLRGRVQDLEEGMQKLTDLEDRYQQSLNWIDQLQAQKEILREENVEWIKKLEEEKRRVVYILSQIGDMAGHWEGEVRYLLNHTSPYLLDGRLFDFLTKCYRMVDRFTRMR